MPPPGEHKSVQTRILEYAESTGWTRMSREEAERRRGFDPDDPAPERARYRSLFFDDLIGAKVRKRERDLVLIDYDDPARNVFEVTEEWAFHSGHYGTREDVVFLINGIPVLVIECKSANKDELIDPETRYAECSSWGEKGEHVVKEANDHG